MNCRHVERRLSDDFEGRLSPGAARAVAAHLRDCPACRRFRDDLLAAEATLREPWDPLPPPGLEQRAVRRWIAQQEARRWSAVRLLPSGIRAAALLLAVLSLTFMLASPSFG